MGASDGAIRADDRSPGTRQIGHGPSRGSVPNRTDPGPRTTTVLPTVSYTVTETVSVEPLTRPLNCAGMVGPMAIG